MSRADFSYIMEMIEELVMKVGGYGLFAGVAAGMVLKVN